MTAATWPQASGYDDVVDLSRYPINDPATRRTGPSSGRAGTSSVTRGWPS
jgi:hypothetical protein